MDGVESGESAWSGRRCYSALGPRCASWSGPELFSVGDLEDLFEAPFTVSTEPEFHLTIDQNTCYFMPYSRLVGSVIETDLRRSVYFNRVCIAAHALLCDPFLDTSDLTPPGLVPLKAWYCILRRAFSLMHFRVHLITSELSDFH